MPSEREPLLKVDDLQVSYGDVQVVWGISLHVGSGEVVALVGPNGAGKSTTLKTISGVLRPKAGSITFCGRRIDTEAPEQIAALGIAHVPEGRRIFPELTVEENLEVGAFLPRTRPRLRALLEEIYELFPVLREKRRAAGATLSGGQQQMLAIGRGLMADPKFLILDEPSLGLAPKLVRDVFGLVRRIQARGVAILLVEQNARQSLEVANRGYVLQAGRIVTADDARNLRDRRTQWAAYFGQRPGARAADGA
jgi:branched-chain amino acid transport system ATP-binding protein